MDKNLIFDIGFHKCEDIGYYLHCGYNVVGADADPRMVENAKTNFADMCSKGRLRVYNYAVSEKDNEEVTFNVSEWSLWNSLRPEIANRDNKKSEAIKVKTRRLDTLISEHGTPYYCKIDIEGYDALAVKTLESAAERPTFISVETECIGDSEIIDETKALETLVNLNEIGYNRFKLVDQKTLEVLSMKPFYGVKHELPMQRQGLFDRILGRNKPAPVAISNFDRMRRKHNYNFPASSSGPFGEQLEGNWVDFKTAKEMLVFHRKMFFDQQGVSNYSFWCDWHATISK